MIERSRIEHIVESGVCAPSGDNSQPWSFSIEEDSVRIFAHPEEDHRILNIEGRGTYLATGALIENIMIAAEHNGLRADTIVFPEPATAALVKFSELTSRGHHLYDAIHQRHTHRGPYDHKRAIAHEKIDDIRERHCTVKVITERQAIRSISTAVSKMEEVALSTRKLHELFFDSILWSSDDNASGAPGLYVRTTELPAPVQVLFRLIKHWPMQRFFNVFGLPKAAAAANATVYERSAAVVAITVDRTQSTDFISAGRCMQRAWLELTTAGLVAQPLAGLLYLAEYLTRTPDTDFSPSTVESVLRARTSIEAATASRPGSIAMLMRIGYPLKKVSARSARRTPRFV